MNPLSKRNKLFRIMGRLSFKFLLFFFSVIFTAGAKGQSTCIAIIDSNKTEFCFSDSSVTFSTAVALGQNVEWLSSGDGTFDNRFAQRPTYTPGPGDYANGYAFIYLDVYKDDPVDYCSALPVVTLNLGSMRTTATPVSQIMCSGSALNPIVLSGPLGTTVYNWTRNNTTLTGMPNSGAGNIRGFLHNTTPDPVTITFTVTPTTPGCQAAPITATALVNPRITATASTSTQTICSGSNITPVLLSSTANNTTLSWTRNKTDSISGIAASGTGNITGILTNTNTVPVTVTFTVVPTANGCTGAAITSTVVVNPTSVVATATPALQTICSGSGITPIIPGGSPGGTVYNWVRNNTAPVTGIAASGAGTISGTLTNNTAAPLYVTFTVTPTSSSCANRASVLVNPRPTAVAAPLTQTVCSGTLMSPLVFSGAVRGTVFNWTRNNTAAVTGIGASGSGNVIGTLVNTTNAPVTLTFTITPVANGCTGTPITASVVVNPSPGTALVSPATQTICSGSTIAPVIVSGGAAGAVYSWTRNNTVTVTGIAASGTGNISGDLTNNSNSAATVTFNVAAILNGCSGPAVPAMVTVNPRPTSQISGDNTICAGQPLPVVSIAFTGTGPWTFTYSEGITPVTVTGNTDNPYNFSAPALPCSYTVTALNDANCEAVVSGLTGSATLTQLKYAVAAAAGLNGSISPADTTQVNCGTDQVYNITPNAGATIQDVVVDGVSQGPLSTYTFSNVTAPHSISAVFSSAGLSIIASAGANGSITPAGVVPVTAGGKETFEIIPAACYQVADVLVDGVSVGAVTTYSFSDINASHTISVSFSLIGYDITASAGANGNITPAGTTMVGCGQNQTYDIVAASCYQIADVLVDGISVGAVSSYTFSNVTAAHTIAASFSQPVYSINATAAANGSISPAGITGVNCGASQLYNITPDAGYNILDVIIDGVSQGPLNNFNFIEVTAPHTIHAVFGTGSFTITATAGANGTITPAGAVGVATGNNQTFTISANSCYQVLDVQVDGVSVGAVSSYTFNNVTAPHTINATFLQPSYIITASADANGSITPAGPTSVSCGNNQAYTITANAGYAIQNVLVDGVSVGAVAGYTFTNVTAPHSISVTFSSVSYAITASAGANGSITPAGTVSVGSGGSQTFTIAANSCYQIADVLVDGVSVGAVSNYTFNNVTAPHTISASFTQLSFIITASAGANGSITPAGATGVNCGNNQAYSITANAGYTIQNVLVDGVSVGAVAGYTFTNVTAPHSISVTFSSVSYAINASAGANGSITPAGTVNVGSGGSQTFTIVANSCYQIANVLVDGVSVGAVSGYTFNNVTEPHTISTSFAQLTYAITASAGANGSITPAGVTNIACGAAQTYSITPNAGYAIQNVLADGVSVGAVPTYTFSNVTAAHTLSVSFVTAVSCTAPTLSSTFTNVLCRNATTGAINLTATGGTAPYTFAWTGPNGFTAVTEDLTGLAAGTYNVTVTATGGCFSTRVVTLVQPASVVAASISTAVFACSAATTTLTVSSSGGTGARQFSLNGGAFQTANTFTVTAAGSPYTVVARDVNLCTATTSPLVVQPAPTAVPAKPVALEGPLFGLCGGGNFSYSIQPVPTATSYYWTGPAGFNFVTGQGTTAVQVSVPSTFTTIGGIWVTARNACGSSAGLSTTVSSRLSYPASSMTGPSSVLANQANVQYSLPFVAGATYNWLVPTGASVTSGQGTNSVLIRFGTAGGNVNTDITNACGVGPRVSKAVTIGLARPSGTASRSITGSSEKVIEKGADLTVYPNPTSGTATILFNALQAGTKFELVITNTLGEKLISKSGITVAGGNMMQLNLEQLRNGLYLVRLVTGTTIQTQKLLKAR